MPRHKHILILGGTAEARDIATQLVEVGWNVTTSLAGVTSNPLLPKGQIRIGGFGGVEGLRDYLIAEKVDVLIDATHPFAAIMSRHAFEAVSGSGIGLMRFERPAWQLEAGDNWIDVATLENAVAALPSKARVFVTTGRKGLATLFARTDLSGVLRTVEPPAETMPAGWRLILDRPPHDVESELRLFRREGFTHILSKNSGGAATYAKIFAARALGLPVVMVQRPWKPPCATFASMNKIIASLGSFTDAG